jgi:peroxiredoxin Q/BCP
MSKRRLLTLSALLLAAAALPSLAATPGPGQTAPDFTLQTPSGIPVELRLLNSTSPVVLVVFGGYPGYACPYCLQQMQDFVQAAPQFAALRAQVLFVYPGAPSGLIAEANALLAAQPLPSGFQMVLDPGYSFTNLYGLRWNSPNETAYPATFIIDRGGSIFSAVISKSHSTYSTSADTLAALNADSGMPKELPKN